MRGYEDDPTLLIHAPAHAHGPTCEVWSDRHGLQMQHSMACISVTS